MHRPLQSILTGLLLCIFAMCPVFMSGNNKEKAGVPTQTVLILYTSPQNTVVKSTDEMFRDELDFLYDSLHLKELGLQKEALEFALKGYKKLVHEEVLPNDSVLSICDFSQSSRKKRLYVLDLAHKRLLVNTYVAHGKRSGKEFARSFSNKPESYKSSLGFYITRNTYQGANGLSLNIDGLEQGINDKAFERRSVIHSSN
ncbi:MAG: murein L,D-transpeptidase catalytic domain family protein, partial [Niastella sp.]|nr:murein L,D-transpeptidase catalytic domain family protein [Niastella sp.]